jgi:hypothetical protein
MLTQQNSRWPSLSHMHKPADFDFDRNLQRKLGPETMMMTVHSFLKRRFSSPLTHFTTTILFSHHDHFFLFPITRKSLQKEKNHSYSKAMDLMLEIFIPGMAKRGLFD